jgi:hypothetical protein
MDHLELSLASFRGLAAAGDQAGVGGFDGFSSKFATPGSAR